MKTLARRSATRGKAPAATDRDIAALAAKGVQRSFPRNTIVVTESDSTDALYVIVAGRVKVFVADAEGHELVLGEMGEGEYFGEMVLDGGSRSASVMTLEKSRFSVVSREALVAHLASSPAFAMRLITHLIRRVRNLTANVKSLALLDVYGRVTRLLIELAEAGSVQAGEPVVSGRLTHQDIASRIGASREMVTRVLRELQIGGYIAVEARRIVVKRALPEHW